MKWNGEIGCIKDNRIGCLVKMKEMRIEHWKERKIGRKERTKRKSKKEETKRKGKERKQNENKAERIRKQKEDKG